MEPAFHRRIHDASLGQTKEKISDRKTKNCGRPKRSRQSKVEVSLDNTDAVIDGCPGDHSRQRRPSYLWVAVSTVAARVGAWAEGLV